MKTTVCLKCESIFSNLVPLLKCNIMQISLTLRNLKQPNASSYSLVHFNTTFPNFHMSEHNLTTPLDVLVIKIMILFKKNWKEFCIYFSPSNFWQILKRRRNSKTMFEQPLHLSSHVGQTNLSLRRQTIITLSLLSRAFLSFAMSYHNWLSSF